MCVVGQRHAPVALTLGKRPDTHGDGWAPGPVWTGAENLASTGIQSPDLPARSESLYLLSYRSPLILLENKFETHYFQILLGRK